MKISKWTPAILAVAALVTFTGCATTGGGNVPAGPSDEELVNDLLNNMMEALKAQDIDAVAMAYADDFQSDQGQDKGATVEFLKSVKEQGFLDGMEVDAANLAVAIEGETATAEGVEVRGAFGVLGLSFKMEKRDGNWLVTYQSQQ